MSAFYRVRSDGPPGWRIQRSSPSGPSHQTPFVRYQLQCVPNIKPCSRRFAPPRPLNQPKQLINLMCLACILER